MGSRVLEQLIFFITSIYTGHLGEEYLDAMALGITAVNVGGVSMVYGINLACDTLFSQTNGSKNRGNLGNLLQKALIINFLLCIPCSALFLNVEHIFVLLGEDRKISRLAGVYTTGAIPTLPAFCAMMVLSKYLFSQGIVRPTLVILIIMDVEHIITLVVCLNHLHLDMIGIVLSLNITYWSGAILHVLYIYCSGVYKDTWPGWTVACLLDWGVFLNLALRGLMMMCSTWWCFEIYVVLADLLGVVELGAHSIAFQLTMMVEMVSWGLATATSVRVGNLLGSGDYEVARTTYCVSMVTSSILSVIITLILLSLGHLLPLVFTDDKKVVALVTCLLPVLGLFFISDAIKSVFGGMMAGLGYQQYGAIVNIIAVYVVGLPTGCVLMFKTPLRLIGTWIAISLGEVTKDILFYIKLRKVDWSEESSLAQVRIGCTKEQETDYGSMSHEDCEADRTSAEKSGTKDNRHVRTVIAKRIYSLTGLCVVLAVGVIADKYLDETRLQHNGLTHGHPPNASFNASNMEFIPLNTTAYTLL